MDAWFKSIFDNEFTAVIGLTDFLLCVGISLVCGLIIALSYMIKNRCTKGFAVTLAILPAAVCVVVMMVNGIVGPITLGIPPDRRGRWPVPCR